ncbi:response regulator [Agathobacter sp.]
MRILIVDDEKMVLEESKEIVKAVKPDDEVICADKSTQALDIIKQNHIDVALLDIEMPGMDGLTLAKRIKETDPDTNIIFVTAYSKYAVDAFGMYVSGYLLKPLQESDFAEALRNLRTPVHTSEEADKNVSVSEKAVQDKIHIQCFGNFEVYKGDEIVQFPRAKSKELFAYLVSINGEVANTSQLCTVLWEDSALQDKNRHYLRNLLSDLKKTFKAYGAQDVLIIKRNQFAIATDKVDCDYYRFLQKDAEAVNEYRGEFMKQYQWAEFED